MHGCTAQLIDVANPYDGTIGNILLQNNNNRFTRRKKATLDFFLTKLRINGHSIISEKPTRRETQRRRTQSKLKMRR